MNATVYGIKQGGQVLYVGKSVSFKSRKAAHFTGNGIGKVNQGCEMVVFAMLEPELAAVVETALIRHFWNIGQCRENKHNWGTRFLKTFNGKSHRNAKAKCLSSGCGEFVLSRGLCSSCYQMARFAVMKGKTNWKKLERDGKCGPSRKRHSNIFSTAL
ncbi:MAG: hypothetical protein V4563_15920 [Pseudomonadota bacterium]